MIEIHFALHRSDAEPKEGVGKNEHVFYGLVVPRLGEEVNFTTEKNEDFIVGEVTLVYHDMCEYSRVVVCVMIREDYDLTMQRFAGEKQ